MKIFEDRDIESVPLIQYVSWFLDNDNQEYNLVQLPPIQRNAVWKIAQIEKLWDSLLRGFPIGSFLLSKRVKGVRTRAINEVEQVNSDKNGYFLLDGQQRTRAILLGFKYAQDARLWIDLTPQLNFDNAEFNDRHFMVRLTTSYQPWGMRKDNPSKKISEFRKHKARQQVYPERIRYDYQVKIKTPKNGIRVSYPIDANLPVPLDDLIELCGGFTGNFKNPKWEQVLSLVPSNFKEDINSISTPPGHFLKIIQSLKRILDNSKNNTLKRSVALLLHSGDFDNTNQVEKQSAIQQDAIEVLFRRVNAGGTILAGEEMQYSILKATWDGAYDMVSKTVNEIGYLLSPTGLVMSATRLALYNIGETDMPNPNINNFRQWIGKKEGNNTFLQQLKKLLVFDKQIDKQATKSVFSEVLRLFCKTVLYREKQENDIGLPKKLLLSIDKKYYQPVLTWIYLHRTNEERIEQNRKGILRYLIYAFIGFNKPDKVSKKAIELLKTEIDSFPDLKIYQECLNDDKDSLAIYIPTVAEFKVTLKYKSNGYLRYWEEIIGPEEDKSMHFRKVFWYKKELLIWFQRYYSSLWFKCYNPMSTDSYDTPYDYDHILPYSHIVGSGRRNNIYNKEKDNIHKFYHGRWGYINSIGNYRLWPGWANRSDGNDCHSIKLNLNLDDLSNDKKAEDLCLSSKFDFMKASAINVGDLEFWKHAAGNPKDWDEVRRINWQKAVEKRVLFLYEIFYTSFDFQVWVDEEIEE